MTDDLTLLSAWSPLAARFVSAIGSEDFPVALTAALSHLAPFDTVMATFYRDMADEMGCGFFDAASVAVATPIDGVHLDAENTRAIGRALEPIVRMQLGM